jgi:hypothetical protein
VLASRVLTLRPVVSSTAKNGAISQNDRGTRSGHQRQIAPIAVSAAHRPTKDSVLISEVCGTSRTPVSRLSGPAASIRYATNREAP